MKNYLLTILLMPLFLQCQSEINTEPKQVAETYAVTDGVAFGQKFTVQQFDQVTLYGGEAPRRLHIAAQQITDSRCPANATCIQYGNATVVLSASNSQGKNENLQLCIGSCGAGGIRSTHSVTAAVGETAYIFGLVEVKPFPGLEKEGDVKQARLIIEKIENSASQANAL